MGKKLYSISELINENIRLKKKLEKLEESHSQSMINLIEFLRPYLICCPLDIDKLINGLKGGKRT